MTKVEANKKNKIGRNTSTVLIKLKDNFLKHYDLYLLSLPTFIYIIVFLYIPMYGVQIAFKDFIPSNGYWNSEWVGLEHFVRFFNSHQFLKLITNTLGISFYQLIVSFPIPIIFALLLNVIMQKNVKKTMQMLTYFPHFISVVVMVSLLNVLLTPNTGILNRFLENITGEQINFFGRSDIFKSLYVFSGLWQGMGWSSIIYVSALSGVDPSLHEAAKIDGANKLQRIINVDLAGILPTITIMLILAMGQIMSVGFEKVLLMQTPLNLEASEVISTYVYKLGVQGGDYSFASAVGLFNSVVNFIFLITVNKISRSFSENSLW